MADSEEQPEPKSPGDWLFPGIGLIGIGSLAPIGAFYFATGQEDWQEFSGWRVMLLPFGFWILSGQLLKGVAVLWFGGFKKFEDFEERAKNVLDKWNIVGLWVIGIVIGIFIAVVAFSSVSEFLSDISGGTKLIAALLFAILLVLMAKK